MALIVLSGIPGSGKTHLANNLKPLFEAEGHECVIVPEPSVEDGAFSSSRLETQGRSDFKAAIRRALSPEKVVIADGMNFIKGFRYELYCFAREQNLKFCCAFLDTDQKIARERSLSRYPTKNLDDLYGRMETPNERNKWDRPLFVVKDGNDAQILEAIKNSALSKSNRLAPKKATASAMGSSASVNDRLDREINEFCNELLKIQSNVPLGSKVNVCGATFVLKKILNSGQLKRARREFADRAKTISDTASIAQSFADSLQLLF
ncbi:Protein KTI12 like protein [Tritrichomonas foetus]|uniref:Protein KTI12 like protein n=1 Tax=Tritrichomonas foetus TaxID=1144522 RepID=A0A1J4K3H2_9EUKA|nr:Protein KTI12 like protein [Tritrichomonas foetus]|eukprot:OHT05731.1 Protein KTI12 like protein [Tritrichomonas foetus]